MGYRREPEVRLAVHGSEAVLVVAGILAEAGYSDAWYSPGGNEVVTTQAAWDALNDEQRAEVAKLTGGAAPTAPAGAGSDVGAEPPRNADEAMPPHSGAGSGRGAWAAYAASKGITVPADAGRDEIIELVEAQR